MNHMFTFPLRRAYKARTIVGILVLGLANRDLGNQYRDTRRTGATADKYKELLDSVHCWLDHRLSFGLTTILSNRVKNSGLTGPISRPLKPAERDVLLWDVLLNLSLFSSFAFRKQY